MLKRNPMIVIFEYPHDWINVFSQTFWLGSPVCHARLLFKLGGNWCNTDLTWDGQLVYPLECEDNGFYVCEHAYEVYQFYASDVQLKRAIDRMMIVKGLNLYWSNWYAVHALLRGFFPSLNCVSYISYLLFGHPLYDLPDELRREMMEVVNE